MIQTAKQFNRKMITNKQNIIEYHKKNIETKMNKSVNEGKYDVTIKVPDFVLKEIKAYFTKRGYYTQLSRKGLLISWHSSYLKVLDIIKKRGNYNGK